MILEDDGCDYDTKMPSPRLMMWPTDQLMLLSALEYWLSKKCSRCGRQWGAPSALYQGYPPRTPCPIPRLS